MLQEADAICGHNIIGFDIPAIQKVYPWFHPQGEVIDTLVYSRVAVPEVNQFDFGLFRKGLLPGKLIGSYALEAWGYRLGVFKGDFGKTTDWATWSQEMSDYCVQDVKVTARLWKRLKDVDIPKECLELEHKVAEIISRQERKGFLFDEEKAKALYVRLLEERIPLLEELREIFPPWYAPQTRKIFTPKRDNKRLGYREGCPMTKIKLVEFNPNSGLHVAHVLRKHYGWKPTEFTDKSGQPKIDDEILAALPYPEAKKIARYMLVNKRISQLAEGDEAWLKHIAADGRIHGAVNSNGAVTGRMTHYHPNLAQVPSVESPYGKECRELFKVPSGSKLVGCDASGLEARCKAHYLYRYDGGEFVKIILEGNKEEGTDIHSLNAKILGCPRYRAKTWYYAWMYGAGPEKLARILGCTVKEAKEKIDLFLVEFPALDKLIKAVQHKARTQKHIRGLDGRKVPVRSLHSALNTLLQGAGALIMKKALVLADERMREAGLVYEFVANVHDEFQAEVMESDAKQAGEIMRQAIIDAGKHFNFNCPLDAEYKIGDSWADTH